MKKIKFIKKLVKNKDELQINLDLQLEKLNKNYDLVSERFNHALAQYNKGNYTLQQLTYQLHTLKLVSDKKHVTKLKLLKTKINTPNLENNLEVLKKEYNSAAEQYQELKDQISNPKRYDLYVALHKQMNYLDTVSNYTITTEYKLEKQKALETVEKLDIDQYIGECTEEGPHTKKHPSLDDILVNYYSPKKEFYNKIRAEDAKKSYHTE